MRSYSLAVASANPREPVSPALPGSRHVPATRRGARTGPAARIVSARLPWAEGRRHRRDYRAGRSPVSAADRLAASRATHSLRGASPAPRRSPRGCRSSTAVTRLHLLHRAVRPRPERSRPSTTSWPKRAASPRRLPRADPARSERQQLRPDLRREALRPHRHGTFRRTPVDLRSRPDLAELLHEIDAIHGPTVSRRYRACVHHLPPMGSVRPADRRHGELRIGG